MVDVEASIGSGFSASRLTSWFAPFDGADHIALGVSGGGDSVALMVLAQRWQESADAPKITILTVNHNLRAEAAIEAAQVGQWADALGFDHHVLDWMGDKPKSGLQAAARAARYELMFDWCAAHGVRHLGVAHNLDDQAETLVMRLARGSGLDGLAAMAAVSHRGAIALVRPLLDVPRADLRAMLAKSGQPWLEDPSNQDDQFERVRVRKLLEGLSTIGLEREKLALAAHRLGRARAALDDMARVAAQKTVTAFAAGFCALKLEALLEYPPEIGLRVLKSCLIDIGGAALAPRLERLEALYETLLLPEFSGRTLAGCKITLKQGIVLIAREPGRGGVFETPIKPGISFLWDRRFEVAVSVPEASHMTVRALGRDGRKNLEDHAVLAHLPAFIAETLPSFWHDHALLAVPHLDFYAKPSYVKQINLQFCAKENLGTLEDLTPDALQNCGIFTKFG